LTYITVTLYC